VGEDARHGKDNIVDGLRGSRVGNLVLNVSRTDGGRHHVAGELEDNVSVGDHIRYARRQLGLSQQDLATRVGVTRSTIIQWESGATGPSSRKLGLVAHVVGMRLEELLADPPEAPVREEKDPEQTEDAPAFERLAQLWLRLSDRDRRVLLRMVEVLAEDEPQPGPALGKSEL
jgi:transcriptional regulator with XRE-family HTH domain